MIKKILTIIILFSAGMLFAQLPTANGEIVEHTYYTLSYMEDYEQAEWVFYKLTLDSFNDVERKDDFRADPKVSTGSATLKDYRGSGYDRGHLAPAASLSMNEESMSESFYMSNMSPQAPSFNRGIWKQLETLVRQWAVEEQFLYVVTGPVLTPGLPTIGDDVAVPEYYYKIIYAPISHKMKGFLLPNEKAVQGLEAFIVPVDYIESVTNIDFFPYIKDSLEDELESK